MQPANFSFSVAFASSSIINRPSAAPEHGPRHMIFTSSLAGTYSSYLGTRGMR